MPRKIRREIGTIYEEKTIPTFWDKCVEGAKAVAGFVVLCVIIALIFG